MKEKKEKKQNGYFRHMAEAIKMELREHKSSFMVYLILRILVIVMLVLQVLNQNYENVFLCILTLLLLIVPRSLSALLDEDEMVRFVQGDFRECPYYQVGDEYRVVRKQM